MPYLKHTRSKMRAATAHDKSRDLDQEIVDKKINK